MTAADPDVNAAAVAAYRASVQAGIPLSERKLAGQFGMTSRRWARNRTQPDASRPYRRFLVLRLVAYLGLRSVQITHVWATLMDASGVRCVPGDRLDEFLLGSACGVPRHGLSAEE